MKSIELKGTLRKELGKKATKKVRNEESIPCVLYGQGDPVHFIANEKEYGQVIYTPSTYKININIDGSVHSCIMKAIQFHPVSDRPIHIDFVRVVDGKPVEVTIPVRLEGFAKGVQQGGKLKLEMRRVTVKGEINNLPDELVLDVTPIEVGQSIKVRDLSFPGFEILDPKNAVISSVKTTRAAKGSAEGSGAEGK